MEEIDLKELLIALWKKKLFIIITTIIFILISFLIFGIKDVKNIAKNKNAETLYYAGTTFIVGTAKTSHTEYNLEDTPPISVTGQSRVTQTDALSQTYSEIIKSKTSLNKIINELNLDIDANSLSNLIYFSRVSESDFLSVVVAYKDKDKAIQIANKLMDEFIDNMKNSYSTDQVSVIDEAYLLSNADIANFANLSSKNSTASDTTSTIPTPTSISNASFKHMIKCIIIGAFLGAILSVGIVFLIEIYDDSIKSEDYLDKDSLLAILNKNKIDVKNEFAILKIRLEQFKTLLITAPDEMADTTYISNNLASSFANSKNKVLLLNLSSNESELVNEYKEKGLLDYINDTNKNINNYISKTTVNNLDALFVGNKNNIYIEETQLQELLNSLENIYDTIIINSQNILSEPNTLATSKLVRNTILVATQRKTKTSNFNKATRILNEMDGKVVGNILIK